MKQPLIIHNHVDADGNPAGGEVIAQGLTIMWQAGPLGPGPLPEIDEENNIANGAFLETVIEGCIHRLEFFQASPFACDHNAAALHHLNHALTSLEERTKERRERGVEGTHEL